MDEMLFNRLAPVVRRIKFRRVAIVLAIVWFIAATIAVGLFYLNRSGAMDPSRFLWGLLAGTFIVSLIGGWCALRSTRSVIQVAAELERQFPDLDTSLITAMEQKPEPGQRLGFLQQDVLRKAVTHSYVNPWPSIIPSWQLVAAPLAGVFGLLAFGIAMICLVFFAKPLPPDPTIEFADAAVEKVNFEITVEPGNAQVERGTSLLVLARFADALPPDAALVFTDANGVESKLSMSKSLDDPVFGARISSVRQPLTYRVEFANRQSDPYDVSVFDFPKLVRADATLNYPEYTELEEKTVQDVRRLNAVEGTVADLAFFVNKPVATAWLVPRDNESEGGRVELIPDTDDPKMLKAQIRLDRSQKYELELVDESSRKNRTPPSFIFNMLENRVPELKLLAPGRDIQASPLEEVQLSANAWDDFGLQAFGLSYGIPGQDLKEIVLEQKTVAKKRTQVDYLLALEQLDAQPDDLVSYFFWADDFGPDGKVRRTMGDMYFAEVRHFEEIFRQGQAPPGGQQQQQQQQQGAQNAQAAQELGELQKQIINANWKLIRRETVGSPSAEFGDDTELLAQSQSTAIEKLTELAEQVEDPKSRTYVETVRTLMNQVVLDLTRANHDGDVAALQPALSKEQAAYQGLLKLRAREHEVVRQQQQQSMQASQQNNRSQQQLDQLNLEEDENRYENQRTAQEQSEQNKQQQEDRQVLSRLRELARRQEDLNERIKELQSSLEEAKTREEQEEIERRLKSLREQQEQLLRDTEELADRMQSEENRQRMAEESERLQQTRENQQRAAEALKQNEISKAAAEGTRAQRDLEELRDEFQNRAANQFTEQMRQMRNEAQSLEQKQQEIGQELSDQPKPQKKTAPSLRDSEDAGPDLEQQLADQQQAVKDLREQMQQTIEQAEPFEPLLAEQLYETYRKSEVSRPDEALESTRRSLDRGWVDDARTEAERARQGIEQMREGIEKAAESVLGDETKALKAAREKLDDLKQELDQEIKSRDPSQQPSDGSRANEASDNQNGRPRDSNDGNEGNERSRSGQERAGDQPNQPNEDQDSQDRNGRAQREQQRPQDGQSGSGDQQDRPNQDQKNPASNQQGQPQDGQSQASQSEDNKAQEGQPQNGQSQNGQPQDGQPQDGQPQSGQRGGQSPEGNGQSREQQRAAEAERMRQQMRELGANEPAASDGNQRAGQRSGGGNQRMMQPISGDDFRDWSDRLRDVEEMIGDPDLRAEASRIREQAREIRREMKRHSAEPNWDLVKMKVAKPLAELQDRVSEEIIRRSSRDALVPLDRDPVPAEFQDAVRRYYERLGSGQ